MHQNRGRVSKTFVSENAIKRRYQAEILKMISLIEWVSVSHFGLCLYIQKLVVSD